MLFRVWGLRYENLIQSLNRLYILFRGHPSVTSSSTWVVFQFSARLGFRFWYSWRISQKMRATVVTDSARFVAPGLNVWWEMTIGRPMKLQESVQDVLRYAIGLLGNVGDVLRRCAVPAAFGASFLRQGRCPP